MIDLDSGGLKRNWPCSFGDGVGVVRSFESSTSSLSLSSGGLSVYSPPAISRTQKLGLTNGLVGELERIDEFLEPSSLLGSSILGHESMSVLQSLSSVSFDL